MFLSNAKGWDNMVSKRQMVIEVEAKSVCEIVHTKLSEGWFYKNTVLSYTAGIPAKVYAILLFEK